MNDIKTLAKLYKKIVRDEEWEKNQHNSLLKYIKMNELLPIYYRESTNDPAS